MDFVRAGRSILFSEPPLYKPHLWFILTDPDAADKVVAVMLRTVKAYTDSTFVLGVGDHPSPVGGRLLAGKTSFGRRNPCGPQERPVPPEGRHEPRSARACPRRTPGFAADCTGAR